jgi:hypothetical protein
MGLLGNLSKREGQRVFDFAERLHQACVVLSEPSVRPMIGDPNS